MTDPQKDEHIEELLSKLQGIFGKLSHSEEEEAKQTREIPGSAPNAPESKAQTVPEPSAPPPLKLYSDPEKTQTPPAPTSAPFAPVTQGSYESIVTTEDPERLSI